MKDYTRTESALLGENEGMLGHMRIALIFFAKQTHTKLKKKPEEYSMEEMLDLMDKMKDRIATKRWRAWYATLDIIKQPSAVFAILTLILTIVAILKN